MCECLQVGVVAAVSVSVSVSAAGAAGAVVQNAQAVVSPRFVREERAINMADCHSKGALFMAVLSPPLLL